MNDSDIFGVGMVAGAFFLLFFVVILIMLFNWDRQHNLGICATANNVYECEYIAVPKAQEGE